MKSETENTAIKLRLYPDEEQKQLLSQDFGNHRFAYNWALGLKLEQYKAWVAAGKPENFKWLTYYDLVPMLRQLRDKTEWLQHTPSQCLQQSLRHLETAFTRWFRQQGSHPKFKTKYAKQAVHYPNNTVMAFRHLASQHRTLYCQLPANLSVVKAKLHRPLPEGRLLRTVVSKEGERYFISFLYEVAEGYSLRQSDHPRLPKCGIDLGVVQPLTVSYKKQGVWASKVFGVAQKKQLEKLELRRKKYQRASARKQEAFKKRCRTNKKTGEIVLPSSANLNKAKRKVTRAFQKEKDYRENFAHQVSKALAENFEVIKFEDLNIKGMTKTVRKNEDGSPRVSVKAKSGLNREMLRLGLARVVQLTAYKANLYGGTVRKVDPKFTSQRCSNCGHTSKLNRKSQAYFECDSCNFVLNADENAGRNIYSKRAA